MRKEYNNRWYAPLVNPPVTLDDLASHSKSIFKTYIYKDEVKDIFENHGADKAIEFIKSLQS